MVGRVAIAVGWKLPTLLVSQPNFAVHLFDGHCRVASKGVTGACHRAAPPPRSGTDPAPVEPRFGNYNTARQLHAQASIGFTPIELRIRNKVHIFIRRPANCLAGATVKM